MTEGVNAGVRNERLGVVDALRGFALLAIVLLHNLEHYNIYFNPESLPAWMQRVDAAVWDTLFFLFAGKAYATFSLLFGFSFYIQMRNAERRGYDFRLRFAWRMLLLSLFALLHSLFYNGDILLLYAVAGLVLIAVCRVREKWVLLIAAVCLLQPLEILRGVLSVCSPETVFPSGFFIPYAERAYDAGVNGRLPEVLRSNITDGILYSNLWQIEAGRLFQTPALFMLGMLLGRRGFFVKSDESARFWKRAAVGAAVIFIPLYILRIRTEGMTEDGFFLFLFNEAYSLSNFAFMVLLVSLFTLAWFAGDGYRWQRFIIPYGRMSLTNYIMQSAIGVSIYYSFGGGLYKYTGGTYTLLIGCAIFLLQLAFSRYWLSRHRQGPLEYLWKRGTWAGAKRRD